MTTKGLSKGENYTVQVSDPGTLEHGQLTQYDFAKLTLPEAEEVPPIVASQANQISADAPTAIDRVRQIEAHFQKSGAFSNGLVPKGSSRAFPATVLRASATCSRPSRCWGGTTSNTPCPCPSCSATLVFLPAWSWGGSILTPRALRTAPGDIKITGKDVHAWVEVAFDRVGWVAFDPTPPKDNVPIPPDPENKSKPKPQVLQPPPPPPQEPADLPPDSTPDAWMQTRRKTTRGFSGVRCSRLLAWH